MADSSIDLIGFSSDDMSDACSVISSDDPEDHAFGRGTPDAETIERMAHMVPQAGEEDPLLAEPDLCGITSSSSSGDESSGPELEEFGCFTTPMEIL